MLMKEKVLNHVSLLLCIFRLTSSSETLDEAIIWHYAGLPLVFEQKENVSNMEPLHDVISYHYV
jgi:hypothetical protein